jgi:hypothetical protein
VIETEPRHRIRHQALGLDALMARFADSQAAVLQALERSVDFAQQAVELRVAGMFGNSFQLVSADLELMTQPGLEAFGGRGNGVGGILGSGHVRHL